MQSLVVSNRNTDMTALVVLVAIQPAYETETSVFVHFHFIDVADAATFTIPMLYFGAVLGLLSLLYKPVFSQSFWRFGLEFFCFFGKFHYDTIAGYDVFVFGKSDDETASFGPDAAVSSTRVPR